MNETVKKTTLENGIRIVTRRMPYVRSVSMGVWVDVGARDETPEENGLCHLIEHMIFKGTRKRNAYGIAKEFDAIGGHTNAFTSMENTCYHAKVMDSHLETMIDILSDIFLNSVFDEGEMEKERPVILQEIGMMEDSPEEYIHILAGHGFWGDHPLGRTILGPRENIASFDAESAKAFFRRLYQPGRIVISAAGNLDHERLVDLVGPLFGAIRRTNGFPERAAAVRRSGVRGHTRDLEQAHVCLGAAGVSIADPRRYPLSLLNTILGGNMSSRMFQEIRERRGLAYSVYSFMSLHVDTGMFGAYAGVDPSNAPETVDLILKALRRMKDERVDEAELRAAKEYTLGNLMLASESNDNQMVRMAQNEIHFNTYVPIQDVADRIKAVTEEEIIDLANCLFTNDPLFLTILGPLDVEKWKLEI